jgi:hypothetical protein
VPFPIYFTKDAKDRAFEQNQGHKDGQEWRPTRADSSRRERVRNDEGG